MSKGHQWIPVDTKPSVDEDLFSEDIMVKSPNKTGEGWYDDYTGTWYIGNDKTPTITVKATHWKPLKK